MKSKLSTWKVVAPVPSQQIKSMVEQLKVLYKTISPLLPEVSYHFFIVNKLTTE